MPPALSRPHRRMSAGSVPKFQTATAAACSTAACCGGLRGMLVSASQHAASQLWSDRRAEVGDGAQHVRGGGAWGVTCSRHERSSNACGTRSHLLGGVQVGDYFAFCAVDSFANAYTTEVDAIASAGAPYTPPSRLPPCLSSCLDAPTAHLGAHAPLRPLLPLSAMLPRPGQCDFTSH